LFADLAGRELVHLAASGRASAGRGAGRRACQMVGSGSLPVATMGDGGDGQTTAHEPAGQCSGADVLRKWRPG
jgi:hypothetical protein